MKSVKTAKVKDKIVLLRDDLNVSMDIRGISDDFRIRCSLPTIEYLLKRGAKVVIMAHLGRPGGVAIPNLSLAPVAKRLSEYLKQEVKMAPCCIGNKVSCLISSLKGGEALMLENVRFYEGEEENDAGFARALASLGDIYVNDAFGVCHRAHASIAGITRFLPAYAGLLLEKEVEVLSRLKDGSDKPLTVIIGGAKVSTKIKLIKIFLGRADHILVGGALANTVLRAKGIAVGKSFVEEGFEEEIKNLSITTTKITLPVDVLVSKSNSGKAPVRISAVGKHDEDELILDIGPDTVELFSQIIKESKTIIWNGPMGLFEVPEFSRGTQAVAEAIARSKAFSVMGGGESVTFVDKLNLTGRFKHISSGGGAMLEFLAGVELPGLKALG